MNVGKKIFKKGELMHIQTKTIANSLSAALKASPVPREDFNNFKSRIVKYVERINSHEHEENLKTHLMDFLKGAFKNFSLQPMDGELKVYNTNLTLDYCMKNPKWRLSLQTHKAIGIR